MASLRERKLTVTDDDEPAQPGGKQPRVPRGRREAGQPQDEGGVPDRGELLDQHPLTRCMTAAGEPDGSLDEGKGRPVTGLARWPHHRVETLKQGFGSRIAAAPPCGRLMLAQELAYSGCQADKRRTTLSAGDFRG